MPTIRIIKISRVELYLAISNDAIPSDFNLKCQAISSLTPYNYDLEHTFSRPKSKF